MLPFPNSHGLDEIMELRVLSRYVCQSKANLDRFEADLLINGAATMQVLLRLHNF